MSYTSPLPKTPQPKQVKHHRLWAGLPQRVQKCLRRFSTHYAAFGIAHGKDAAAAELAHIKKLMQTKYSVAVITYHLQVETIGKKRPRKNGYVWYAPPLYIQKGKWTDLKVLRLLEQTVEEMPDEPYRVARQSPLIGETRYPISYRFLWWLTLAK